jgi:hypothetical protein
MKEEEDRWAGQCHFKDIALRAGVALAEMHSWSRSASLFMLSIHVRNG